MAKKWNGITHKSSPDRIAEIREGAHVAAAILELEELRRRRGLTQAQLAQMVGITQSALSQIENAHNLELATLRKLVESMGGKLKIIAEFQDEAVALT